METIHVHFEIMGIFPGFSKGRQTRDSKAPKKHGILPVNKPQRQAVIKSGVIQWYHQN